MWGVRASLGEALQMLGKVGKAASCEVIKTNKMLHKTVKMYHQKSELMDFVTSIISLRLPSIWGMIMLEFLNYSSHNSLEETRSIMLPWSQLCSCGLQIQLQAHICLHLGKLAPLKVYRISC